jgi:cholesterol transport system auxiliary component
MHLRNRSLVVLAAVLMCACSTSSLFDSETPVPSNYVLASLPAATNRTETAASRADIAIGRPDVAPGLDTDRIAVLKGRELDYFRGTRWGGSVSALVQALLVSSLQDQQLFRSVTAEQARVASDYMLDIEIRDFQAEYAAAGGAPTVRVALLGRLIRIRDRELVDTLSVSATGVAVDNRLNAVVATFETVSQQVASELARNLATVVARDNEARAANETGKR